MAKNSKGYVLCEKGHKAKKVPGEKKSFFCSECELKFTSDDPIRYPSSYEKKSGGGSGKKGCKPKTILNSKENIRLRNCITSDVKLVSVDTCMSCMYKHMCFLVKENPKADFYHSSCEEHKEH